MNKKDRTVYKRDDGKWANQRHGTSRPSTVHETQKEANQKAAEMLTNQGGGERTTMGVKGKIVSKDTIKPGHDPNPPKDKEH